MNSHYKENMKKFGAMVRAKREKAEISVANLAKTANLDPSTVRRFEKGQMAPTVEVVERIVAALEFMKTRQMRASMMEELGDKTAANKFRKVFTLFEKRKFSNDFLKLPIGSFTLKIKKAENNAQSVA